MIGVRHQRRASAMDTRSQMSYGGASLSQTMNYNKMSQATRDALDAIHVQHVSQAKEYETFK